MNEEQIQLKIGDTSFIKLESLATAGYLWNYAIDNGTIIELEKKANEFQAPVAAGNNGMEVFAIKAVKKGVAKISFTQIRKWEENNDAAKKRSFIIIVNSE